MSIIKRGCRSGISIVNFEHISLFALLFLLLTLNIYMSAGYFIISFYRLLVITECTICENQN